MSPAIEEGSVVPRQLFITSIVELAQLHSTVPLPFVRLQLLILYRPAAFEALIPSMVLIYGSYIAV
jgi:hypothetical protein